jgi:hypothetical protein
MFVADVCRQNYLRNIGWPPVLFSGCAHPLAMKLSGSWQNIVGDAAAPVTCLFETPSFLKGQILERPNS